MQRTPHPYKTLKKSLHFHYTIFFFPLDILSSSQEKKVNFLMKANVVTYIYLVVNIIPLKSLSLTHLGLLAFSPQKFGVYRCQVTAFLSYIPHT